MGSRAASRSRLLSPLMLSLLCGALVQSDALANSQQTYLECLLDFERYAETQWHSANHTNAPPDAGYFGDGASGGNGGLRASCGVALAYAVLVQAFPQAANRTARVAKVRRALNYAANTHLSGKYSCVDGRQWGQSWQAGFWGGHMGVACLVAQTHLPAQTIQAVQRAVAEEASYRAAIAPESGYANDTKAEENGWNSHIVALAAAWMPGDTNAVQWLTSAKQ